MRAYIISQHIFTGNIWLKNWQTNHIGVKSPSSYLCGNVRATSLYIFYTSHFWQCKKNPNKPNYILDLTSADLHCSEDQWRVKCWQWQVMISLRNKEHVKETRSRKSLKKGGPDWWCNPEDWYIMTQVRVFRSCKG